MTCVCVYKIVRVAGGLIQLYNIVSRLGLGAWKTISEDALAKAENTTETRSRLSSDLMYIYTPTLDLRCTQIRRANCNFVGSLNIQTLYIIKPLWRSSVSTHIIYGIHLISLLLIYIIRVHRIYDQIAGK